MAFSYRPQSYSLSDIKDIPHKAGVYLFYSLSSDRPIYIGKSIHLKTRIRSYFKANPSHKVNKITKNLARIDIIVTSGELSALLLESHLIKVWLPLYNIRLRRKKYLIGFGLEEKEAYLTVKLLKREDKSRAEVVGAFTSIHSAKKALENLVKTYTLCPKLCALEYYSQACFAFQLHRCRGACVKKESFLTYNERVTLAMANFKKSAWPFSEAIAIKEGSNYLVFNQWRYLGATRQKSKVNALMNSTYSLEEDNDVYRILKYYLTYKLEANLLVREDDIFLYLS